MTGVPGQATLEDLRLLNPGVPLAFAEFEMVSDGHFPKDL
jgi:hypothetical protein